MDTPQRYTTRPLPAYRHLQGRTPHPTRDPAGHSFGGPEPVTPDLNQTPWQHSEEYLYGIDLFNLGFWWECHEILEGLWLAAGRESPAGHALQAVIQCAAAHLKVEAARMSGAGRLLEHSLAHVNWTGPMALGLNLEALLRDTRTYLTLATARPARLVLHFETP